MRGTSGGTKITVRKRQLVKHCPLQADDGNGSTLEASALKFPGQHFF